MNYMCFEIGNRIELRQFTSSSGQVVSDKAYGAMLLDYDGKKTAKISLPIFEGRVIPLAEGDEYQLYFFASTGLFQCMGKIGKRFTDNNIQAMEVTILTEPKKFQRRRFYRLECMFPLKFRVMTDVELLLRERLKQDEFETDEDREICEGAIEKLSSKNWEEGEVSDISGGGVRFHCRKDIKRDTKMEVMIPLSFPQGIVPVKFVLKVITCGRLPQKRTVCEIRGEFEDVKDSDREAVIQYVFEEQRRRMRKEKGTL